MLSHDDHSCQENTHFRWKTRSNLITFFCCVQNDTVFCTFATTCFSHDMAIMRGIAMFSFSNGANSKNLKRKVKIRVSSTVIVSKNDIKILVLTPMWYFLRFSRASFLIDDVKRVLWLKNHHLSAFSWT